MNSNEQYVFIGTYTSVPATSAEGIHLCRFDAASGRLEKIALTGGVTSASYMAISPSKKFLYCVNEVDNFEGKNSGAISAYRIDSENKKLHFLNTVSSNGAHPCYISVNDAGTHVFASNYTGGSIAMSKINADGSLSALFCHIQHEGRSVNKERQEKAHTHSILLDGDLAFATDLGTDKIFVYAIDAKNDRLILQNEVSVPAGYGPRHMAIDKAHNRLYLLNELNSHVCVFEYNGGKLQLLQDFSDIAPNPPDSLAADIAIHQSGKFLYYSVRTMDIIVLCTIDENTRKITLDRTFSCGGNIPRNFCIAPNGKFLLCANQESASVVVFSIDDLSIDDSSTDDSSIGVLSEVSRINIDRPVCVKFV